MVQRVDMGFFQRLLTIPTPPAVAEPPGPPQRPLQAREPGRVAAMAVQPCKGRLLQADSEWIALVFYPFSG